MLHPLLSFANANPSSQAHWYLWLCLLQIWLHPPLLAVSQGCTKDEIIMNYEFNVVGDSERKSVYNLNLFYPCYKYAYLFLIQIQFYKNIDAVPFSWYKLECTRLCWLYHKDGLKVNNNISISTSRLVNINIPLEEVCKSYVCLMNT